MTLDTTASAEDGANKLLTSLLTARTAKDIHRILPDPVIQINDDHCVKGGVLQHSPEDTLLAQYLIMARVLFPAKEIPRESVGIDVVFPGSASSIGTFHSRGLAGVLDQMKLAGISDVLEVALVNRIIYSVIQYETGIQLQKLAFHDKLTGLFNRARFMPLMDGVLREAMSNEGNLSMIMLDIDHFKRVNDTHGHDVGDQVIIRVAQVIQGLTDSYKKEGKMLIPARFGGEEFVILCVDVGQDEALDIAETLRQNVENETITTVKGAQLSQTVSIGVSYSDFRNSEEDNSISIDEAREWLLKGADVALYQAKEGTPVIQALSKRQKFILFVARTLGVKTRELGRNMVVLFSDEQGDTSDHSSQKPTERRTGGRR